MTFIRNWQFYPIYFQNLNQSRVFIPIVSSRLGAHLSNLFWCSNAKKKIIDIDTIATYKDEMKSKTTSKAAFKIQAKIDEACSKHVCVPICGLDSEVVKNRNECCISLSMGIKSMGVIDGDAWSLA